MPRELLRAFPKAPGSSKYVVQNLTKGTEREVDTEAMTCSCPGFGHRRKCKHLEVAVERAKLYAGDRATYERLVERLLAA